MAYDRKDLKAAVADRAHEQQRALMPLTRMLSAAVPVMNSLMTESDAWNRYLEILQGFVEQTKNSKLMAESRLAAPDVWEHGQLMKLKNDVLTCSAMVEALTVAMQLPKALLEGGAAAKEIVAKFEEKNAESAGQAQP